MNPDQEVPVPLNDRDFIDSGRRLAELIAERDRLEMDKHVRMKACTMAIKQKQNEISELAKVMREGCEIQKQGTLTFEESQRALAGVHEAAETNVVTEPEREADA